MTAPTSGNVFMLITIPGFKSLAVEPHIKILLKYTCRWDERLSLDGKSLGNRYFHQKAISNCHDIGEVNLLAHTHIAYTHLLAA